MAHSSISLTQLRRSFLIGGGALVGFGAPAFAKDHADYATRFAAIERRLGGRLGLAALDTGSNRRLAYRANERFAMCSSFKILLAAMVLSKVDRGELALDKRVAYGPADLLGYAPVTRAHVADGGMSIEALCEAAVEVSDNTAANLLLARVGGPAGLTRWLRRLGDRVTRLDRYELALNSNLPGDPRDTSEAGAMVATLKTILLGDAVSPQSRARLIDWMKRSTTGLDRLRAGFPTSWVAGDKTGTSGGGAANDLAIAWPPGRPPILVVSYLNARAASAASLNAAHAEVGAIVAKAFA